MKAAGYIMTAILMFFGIAVFAQRSDTTATYKNEIGVDVANILTFLSKKSESYLLNYNRRITERHTLRSALNLEWSTAQNGYNAINFRVGYARNLPLIADKWRLYYGADASFYYWASNFQPNKVIRGGLHPVLGVSYFLVKQFSVSTEMTLNLFYTDYRNPSSFDPNDNKNVFDVNVGSVGMVVLSYHF
jgi:hypothetical protein